MVSKSRFISGGRQLISNVSYFETPADVTFIGFLMKGIFDTCKVHLRDPEDWGWVGHTLDGMAHSCTFDCRIRRRLSLKNDYLRILDANSDIKELLSPLKDLSVNSLYSL